MSKEIKLNHGLVAIVDDEDYEYLNKFKWCAKPDYTTYYACRTGGYKNGKQLPNILMHRVITKAIGRKDCVDHISRDGLDNRKCNLRICTASKNQMNCIKRSGTSSVYKGVTWCKRSKQWLASLRINGKTIHIGYFNNEKNAAIEYNKKALEFFGEFARTNEGLL